MMKPQIKFWLGLCGLLCSLARPAVAASGDEILFYDPDASYEAVARIIRDFNAHLSERHVDLQLRGKSDVKTLAQAMAVPASSYAIVASGSLAPLKKLGFDLVPLLVPEGEGSVYFRKSLVVQKAQAQAKLDLRNKRIAAAGAGHGQSGGGEVLDGLKQADIKVDGAIVMTTSKDFDALLALSFGQADAALVTGFSLDMLMTVNPAAARNMETVWRSGNILRPVLCSIHGNDSPAQRESLVRALQDASQSVVGRAAMQSWGVQRWVPFSPGHVPKGS